MTHTELKAVIHDLILELHNKEFIGKLTIEDIEPEGYTIKFEVIQERPYSFSYQVSDDKLIKLLKEDLRNAAFLLSERYSVERNTTTFKQNRFIR